MLISYSRCSGGSISMPFW